MQNVPNIPTIQNLEIVFGNVIRAALAFAGVAIFVILVMGGIKYLTSGGDPKAVDSAQKTITYGVGGLIIVLLSYLILLLIQTITGVNVTEFRITQ